MNLLSGANDQVVKVVAVDDGVVIGGRVCLDGDVIEVSEAEAFSAVNRRHPLARLAPDSRFTSSTEELQAGAAAVVGYGRTAKYVGDVAALYPAKKGPKSAKPDAPSGLLGPLVKVKAARGGRVGDVRVSAGDTIEAPESDVVDAMLSGVLERDASILTRAGVDALDAGVQGRYQPPASDREIPKVKIQATRDSVLVSNRVLMAGQVVAIPEDVAYVLMRRRGVDPGFVLAPGERFSLSKRQLKEAASALAGIGLPSV